MTPTAAELLRGVAVTLSIPPEAEDMALFFKGRLGVIGIVSILAVQETERGAAVRVAENADLRALLVAAEADYPPAANLAADPGLDPGDDDLTIAGLDTANAALRRRLIALHAAVEAAGDAARDREILKLYRRMAAARELVLPPMPTAAA